MGDEWTTDQETADYWDLVKERAADNLERLQSWGEWLWAVEYLGVIQCHARAAPAPYRNAIWKLCREWTLRSEVALDVVEGDPDPSPGA